MKWFGQSARCDGILRGDLDDSSICESWHNDE
jgi:hypothetical protein